MAGGPSKGGQLPGDVKASIDQIVEKAAVTAEKEGLRLTALHPEEKPEKIVEKESLLSVSKEKGNINAKNGEKKATPPSHSKEAKLLSDSDVPQARPSHLSENEISSITRTRDTGLTLKMGGKEEGHIIKSETGKMDIPHNIGSSTSSDIINNVKQQPVSARDLLPAYLVNQVGKQISRSILRGERVIRFQLKPPDLGTVKLEMNIKDNILKLGMIAENSLVKELLLSNVHELKQALVEQGVKLDKLDVQINYNFGQSLADSKESTKQNQRWNKGMNSIPFIEESESQIMQRIVSRGDCLLDLMV
jgi:flagellar hook-length control protein FliK